jgi:hypothetical protein
MKLIQDSLDDLKVADQKGRITLGSKYAGKRFSVREEADGTAILTPVLIVPEREKPLTSRRLAESFAALEALKDNWDGRGSPAPSPALIAYAREVLALMQAGALARGLRWMEPHIGSNERGQVTLEWWQDACSLTLFIRSEDQVDYLKSWGSNILDEMEDGEVSRIADFVALSRWLYQGDAPSR